MRFLCPFLLSWVLFGSLVSASAQDRDPLSKLPPPDSIKLSAVIAEVERRPGFFGIESISFAEGRRTMRVGVSMILHGSCSTS